MATRMRHLCVFCTNQKSLTEQPRIPSRRRSIVTNAIAMGFVGSIVEVANGEELRPGKISFFIPDDTMLRHSLILKEVAAQAVLYSLSSGEVGGTVGEGMRTDNMRRGWKR